jgi:hypothetical protein
VENNSVQFDSTRGRLKLVTYMTSAITDFTYPDSGHNEEDPGDEVGFRQLTVLSFQLSIEFNFSIYLHSAHS